MTSMFGHKWISSFGVESDPDKVWYAILKDVSWEKMQYGMNKLADSGQSWPPGAPEFKKLCLGIEEGVGIARPPNAAVSAEMMKGIEYKRSDEEKSKFSSFISDLRSGLK